MLKIVNSRKHGYCDGTSRRSFLQVGAAAGVGLALPDLFRLDALAGQTSSNKALINIFLGGGPPQMDMFDPKPEAPTEFRGEFNPIKTNVDGIQICELMPRLAQMADQFAVIRSVVGTYDDHSSIHTQTGYHRDDLRAVGGRPSLGSIISKLQGGNAGQSAPPFVSTMGDVPHGFLGPVYQAYRPDGQGRENLQLRSITAERLKDRTQLLKSLDDIRRDVDGSGAMEAMDAFTQRAVDVVTSGKLADALDLEKEDPDVRDRYHQGSGERRGDTDNLLLSRRLIEAGVRVVSTSWGGWDTHSDNFNTLRKQLPALDGALASLIKDLTDRGMIKDVTIVMWGEFGRTPRVNGTAGRDHWSRVMQAFVAGGGMKMGQAIGKTDRYGGEAADRPIHLREVFATLYHNLGVDAKRATLIDPAGRPQYIVDGYDPVKELVG